MVNYRSWLIVVVALLGSWVPALGQLIDGNELHAWLQGTKKFVREHRYENWEREMEKSALAEGYIKGIVDSSQRRLFCVPGRVTVRQLMDVTSQYLENHPENRHQPAALIVTTALRQKFPCEK